MAVKYSGLLKFTDEIKAGINLAADGTVEKAVVIDGDGVETPIGGGGGDTPTFTLHIIKGDGIFDIDIKGCMGTTDGSIFNNIIAETADITVLPYNGKALVVVSGTPSTQGGVVSTDIDGNIEALQANNAYLMTGDATVELAASQGE